ncbi:hypothetical protein [Sphingomonas sp.]|jgi:hypothetical protein|uniref:hypothetical protein n=1 Tax=Sphingomonas sp. TaxID=28214 RepID=UPI002608D568|nr:hypothetical protein [Sphingomonas sp.]MDF2495072.1 hypothetical protein [Sphingomonas sp.]
MAVYLVTYDLKAPGRSYQPVHDYLRSFPDWCKGLESVYLIDTTLSTTQVRDALRAKVDGNDKLFVVRITRDWGSVNYGCGDWLNKPGRVF